MLTFGPWQGIDTVRARLEALAELRGLDTELESEGDLIVQEAQVYPPEKPNQRYIRTFLLRDSWRRKAATRSRGRVTVDVENPVFYSQDVMGENQDLEFRGRWKRLRTIGEGRIGPIRARAQAWALRTWRGG